MQIKLITAAALLGIAFTANADVALSKADLLGVWQVEKESMNSNGSNAKTMDTEWNFRDDGTMEGISSESGDKHARINQVRAVLNYSVDNGNLIKQAAPGRSKMETCTAVEKSGQKMVLKCQAVYIFLNKK